MFFMVDQEYGQYEKPEIFHGYVKIENNQVIVWSDDITSPFAVRYAWADNPAEANLYNTAGLPASPFRTDDF